MKVELVGILSVTMKLELKPEIEAGLLAQAQAEGMSLETYVERVLSEQSQASNVPKQRPSNKKSLVQLFAESPLKGLNLEFRRNPSTGRPVGV